MPLPSLSHRSPPKTPAFPNRYAVYFLPSRATIRALTRKKRLQTFHVGSGRKKKQVHLLRVMIGGTVALIHHLEVKIEEGDIETTVPASLPGSPSMQ